MTTQPADEATTDLVGVIEPHQLLGSGYCPACGGRYTSGTKAGIRAHVAEALAPYVRQQRAAALELIIPAERGAL